MENEKFYANNNEVRNLNLIPNFILKPFKFLTQSNEFDKKY